MISPFQRSSKRSSIIGISPIASDRLKMPNVLPEAALDGIYVLRTNFDAQTLDTADVIRSNIQFSQGRTRLPGYEKRRLADSADPSPARRSGPSARVLMHAGLLCAMALRQAWAPLLFMDDDPQLADDPVTKATRSEPAVAKARTRKTSSGEVVHSYRTLLDHLALQNRSTMTIAGSDPCHKITEPTPLQTRAPELVRALPVA
jgi:hypothetical protein